MKRLWGHRAIVGFVILTLATAYAIRENARAIDRINQEGVERRDQSCRISEAKQAKDVSQLERTYRYLLDLSPSEARSTLNQAILQGLPLVEKEARLDDAPPFCDEHDPDGKPIGLAEPDMKVPDRPAGLR